MYHLPRRSAVKAGSYALVYWYLLYMSLVKTKLEIEKITKAGEILATALRKLADVARPGVIINALDELARSIIEDLGGKPAFLNYRPDGATSPYPATLCVSPNDIIVHGVPNKRVIADGDVLSIDCGVIYQGYYADAAITLAMGSVSKEDKKLIAVTKEALMRGIKATQPGNTLGDIGYAIHHYVSRKGFFVAQGLTGHGIGTHLHEEPSVFNEGKPRRGMKLQPGMVLALEPMVAIGSGEIVQLPDESYGTRNRKNAAHFEHTIVITERGPKIVTV